jgi:hypothetical protein
MFSPTNLVRPTSIKTEVARQLMPTALSAFPDSSVFENADWQLCVRRVDISWVARDRANTIIICRKQEASLKIGSTVINCHEFDRMVEFWQEALHYVPRAPATDGWVALCDPKMQGPNLSFQARESCAPHRSWIYLDFYSPDRDAEVERLLALGARCYPWSPVSGLPRPRRLRWK